MAIAGERMPEHFDASRVALRRHEDDAIAAGRWQLSRHEADLVRGVGVMAGKDSNRLCRNALPLEHATAVHVLWRPLDAQLFERRILFGVTALGQPHFPRKALLVNLGRLHRTKRHLPAEDDDRA